MSRAACEYLRGEQGEANVSCDLSMAGCNIVDSFRG